MPKRIRNLIEHYGLLRARDSLQEKEAVLRKDLHSPKENARSNAFCMSRVADIMELDGLLTVLQGADENGWQHLADGLELDWWTMRINLNLMNAGPVIASAFVRNEDERGTWLVERLLSDLRRPGGPELQWIFDPFLEFALRLYCRLERAPAPDFSPVKPAPLGVFTEILDAWDDTRALQIVLGKRCDEHLKRAHWNYNGPWGSFSGLPYAIIPLDILFIQEIRQRMGVETLLPKHPLMDTPMADLTAWKSMPVPKEHPLLAPLLERARKEGFLPPAGEETMITWTRQRDVAAPPPSLEASAPSRARAITPFQKALACLPFAGERPSLADDATPLAFADAATNSKVAFYVDWKIDNASMLQELATGFLEADDAEPELDEHNDVLRISVSRGGKERTFILDRYSERSQCDTLARFLEFYAPKKVALTLMPYENSDSAVYLILAKGERTALKKALKNEADAVVRELAVTADS